MSRTSTDDILGPAGSEPGLRRLRAGRTEPTHPAMVELEVRQEAHATVVEAGPEQLTVWVEGPVHELEPLLLDDHASLGLRALRRRLHRELAGRLVVVAPPVHGDDLRPVPVEVDRIELLLSLRSGGNKGSVTASVTELVTNGWNDDDRELIGSGWAECAVRPSTLVLLSWLHTTQRELERAGDSAKAARVARAAEPLLARYAPGGVLHEAEPEDIEELAPDDGAEELRPERAETRARRAVAAARLRTEADPDRGRRDLLTLAGVVLGVGLWLLGTWGLDPKDMTDLGLLSILRPSALVGMVVLIATFCAELARRKPVGWRLGLPTVAIVMLLHGTPAVLYGTLRYSWAWKHLGILDYIQRHGSVDPHISTLGVYHNWPGFFAGTGALTQLFGLNTAIQVARWWPVLANLAVIPALLYLYRGLWGGRDRRVGWLAVLLFVLANWIGQDYFSPQSLSFLLYLVTIGIVLHHFRRAPATGSDARGLARDRHAARWAGGVAVACSAVIVTSHQVTPFVLVVALLALALTRQTRSVWLAVVVTLMAIVWSFTGAWVFMQGNVASLLSSVGQPVSNADGNLVDQGKLSADQVAVSSFGRLTVLVIGVVAVLGIIGLLRRRSTDSAGLVLLLAPISLLFANSFGGEIGFRTYLFALPILAWYAARALWLVGSGARPPVGRSAVIRALASGLVALILLTGFCFGYYGKDRWYYFSHDEVAASDLVLTDAPPHSLLVTVTANYPGQFKDYENLVYVPIASEPAASRAKVLADPAAALQGWLAGKDYKGGYILLTRSQEREVEALGALPHGAFAKIRHSLDTSPAFKTVFRSPDAQVYVLAAGR